MQTCISSLNEAAPAIKRAKLSRQAGVGGTKAAKAIAKSMNMPTDDLEDSTGFAQSYLSSRYREGV